MPKIGPYTLYTIETGRFKLDGGAMFGIIPKPLWEKKMPADNRNRITMNMRCLLLEGSDRLILIDNGLGDKYDDKFADIYAVDYDYAELHRSLREAGFGAEDVTDVILTHLHFDHCGGSTRRRGEELEVVFENARHHLQGEHWNWALEANPRESGSFLPENLDPLAASGQLNLLDGDGVLLPGIEVGTAYGHTEAQQIVKISGEEGTLVYVADLLPTTAHLKPAWNMAYDLRPLQTIQEKAEFLEEAAEEGWHLFFEHDPDVVVADVESTSEGPETVRHRPLSELN